MNFLQKILVQKISDIHRILSDEGYPQSTIQKYFLSEIFKASFDRCEQHKRNTLNDDDNKKEVLMVMFNKLKRNQQIERVLGNADAELTRLIQLYKLKENITDAENTPKNQTKAIEKKKKKSKDKKKIRTRKRDETIQNRENNQLANTLKWGFMESDNIFMKKVKPLQEGTINNNIFTTESTKYNIQDPKTVRDYLILKEKQLLTKKIMEIQFLTELAGLSNRNLSTAGDFLSNIM